MGRYIPRLLLVFTAVFFILQYFFKPLDPFADVLLDWASILIVFAMAVGISNLMRRKSLSVAEGVRALMVKKKGRQYSLSWIYDLVVLVSFAATVVLGMFNIGETHFMKRNILKDSPSLVRIVVDEVVESDTYMSRFPSKEKFKLFMYKYLNPKYVPRRDELERANISMQDYFSFFDFRENIDRGKMREHFIEEDIEMFEYLSSKVTFVTSIMVDELLPVSRSLKSWSENVLSEKRSRGTGGSAGEFKIGGKPVEGSLRIVRSMEGSEEKMRTFSFFLRQGPLSSVVARAVAPDLSIPLPYESKLRVAEAFISSGTVSYPAVKGVLKWIFDTFYSPLMSTVFALLAFYIVSATYRAFRVSSLYGGVMVFSALIVMAGQVPVGNWLFGHFLPSGSSLSDVGEWILYIPNMAAQRAMYIGIGLHVILLSFRILSGQEPYLPGRE